MMPTTEAQEHGKGSFCVDCFGQSFEAWLLQKNCYYRGIVQNLPQSVTVRAVTE